MSARAAASRGRKSVGAGGEAPLVLRLAVPNRPEQRAALENEPCAVPLSRAAVDLVRGGRRRGATDPHEGILAGDANDGDVPPAQGTSLQGVRAAWPGPT